MNWHKRFQDYLDRPVAQKAAAPLKPGTKVHLRIEATPHSPDTSLLFVRTQSGTVLQLDGDSSEADLSFIIPIAAAEELLSERHDDIGETGVQIVKLIFHSSAQKRIQFELHSSAYALFRKGYLGVITAGGSSFAEALAQRGFSGIGSIRKAITRLRN